MRKRISVLLGILLTAAFVESARARQPEGAGSAKRLTVMTQNLYVGADLSPAIAAILSGDPDQIPPAVSQVWANVQATDFPTRARALAAEIERSQPDLIGLQEAALWRSGPFDGFGLDASRVEYNFVRLLLDALAARGEHYRVVTVFSGFDVEAPRITSLSPLELEDIRLTDHAVILVREASEHGRLILSNGQAGNFLTNVSFGGVTVLYGWASVDVNFGGRKLRFVTTHLESDVEEVRAAQSVEMIAGPLHTERPVILVGDLNSNANGDATSFAYLNFLGAGFTDAWGLANPGVRINTCCNDAFLMNSVPFVQPFGRIDHVLFRGSFNVDGARIVGAKPADRIKGVWPSDHAGVVVEFGGQDRSGDETPGD
ncbi:MAG: endonuclease/exonuclease/phosphatase family protein [Acidobacteriota bacterium]